VPVQLQGCRRTAPKPSPLCAAVCLSVAAAYDPRWLSAPIKSRLPAGLFPQRLSRLKAAVLPAFEAELSRASRRGRPPAPDGQTEARLAQAEALLEVAASVIRELGVRGRSLGDRLVEAAQRLQRDQGIPLKDFARKLGIACRTLRYWARRARPAPEAAQGAPPEPPSHTSAQSPQADGTRDPAPAKETTPQKQGSRNEGRFSLEVCLPGLQAMADTTDIQAFGFNLKLVGSQDTGNRHRRLLESFRVAEAEHAQLIIDVVSQVFAEPAGTQLIVDQGTPYMAELTKKALEKMEVEHCPQKEATATEKAPLERAWRTIKEGLAPLLSLTDRIAKAVPGLRNSALARAATELLVGTYLRVYAAARAPLPHPLEARDPVALVRVVEDAKERARAESRSRKLLLQEIHDRYALEGSRARFVKAHRRAALEDIQAAERRLRDRACRCQVRCCDRYFAAILSRLSEEGGKRRARDRRQLREAEARAAEERSLHAHNRELQADPGRRLHEGLSMLAVQWKDGLLLFEGKGLGRAFVEQAVVESFHRGPLVWEDEVRAAWTRWAARQRQAPPRALVAIQALLEAEIGKLRVRQASLRLPTETPNAILGRTARERNGRPPTSPHLRI
jgi:hypothetical protein